MRISPTESATLYPIGTTKIGNDNNYWTVTSNSKSIKRWVRVKSRKSVSKKSESKTSASKKSKKSASKKFKKSASKKSKKSTSKKSVSKRAISKKSKKSASKKSTSRFNKNTFVTMLANKYNGQEPSNYYISEKLDGMRAIYDGYTNTFISRNNKPINAPLFFTQYFPRDIILDGELFISRKNFKGTGIFRKKIPVESEWKKGVYMVFDTPLIVQPFEERYENMKLLLKDIPYLKVVEQIKVKNIDHMYKFHNKLVEEGAEGSMLREKGSYYENKRSNTLLKIKDFFDDEVVVNSVELGENRLSGVLGALYVKWLNPKMGTSEFKVGSGFNDDERKNYKKLYPKGTIITIKYWEIDPISKKPRFPIFMNIKPQE